LVNVSKGFPREKYEGRSTKESLFVSPREKIPPSEASRLNVFSLFSGDSPPPLLYEITAKTIATLYQGAPFFRPKLEYQLLDALIQKKSPDSFTDLFPEAPGLREIFYKMLKGTNFYSLRPKKGYPPLTDFLTLNAEPHKDYVYNI
jgi:hypothetical protein